MLQKLSISNIPIRSYDECSNCCLFTRTQAQRRLVHLCWMSTVYVTGVAVF